MNPILESLPIDGDTVVYSAIHNFEIIDGVAISFFEPLLRRGLESLNHFRLATNLEGTHHHSKWYIDAIT